MHTKKETRFIEVDLNTISFLLDAISLFEPDVQVDDSDSQRHSDGDYVSEDGEYSLSDEQIKTLVLVLNDLFHGIKSEE
jgi:hypothetical protein